MQINWDTQTVGDVVRANLQAAGVFERHGVDYCCGGRQTMKEAMSDERVNADTLRAELEELSELGAPRVSEWDTGFLIDYIINTHHQYVQDMLPTIQAHAAKVAQVHGDRYPKLRELAAVYMDLQRELEQHLMKEERILFPFIKRMVEHSTEEGTANGEFDVEGPISMMEHEHDRAGLAFDRMRMLSNDFTLPEDACTTFSLLFRELQEFERDLHMHIHLENNVLHPRAMDLQRSLNTK